VRSQVVTLSERRIRITCFVRAGCHLCAEAWLALERLLAQVPPGSAVLEEVDVDGDPDLAARYGAAVPVVAVEGQPVSAGPWSAAAAWRVRRAVRRALRGRQAGGGG
jgi:thioredoxin-like negative regulator of GroEL